MKLFNKACRVSVDVKTPGIGRILGIFFICAAPLIGIAEAKNTPYQDFRLYFEQAEPGDKRAWAGGTLIMGRNGVATYTSATGQVVSFTINTPLGSLYGRYPGIRDSWDAEYGKVWFKKTPAGYVYAANGSYSRFSSEFTSLLLRAAPEVRPEVQMGSVCSASGPCMIKDHHGRTFICVKTTHASCGLPHWLPIWTDEFPCSEACSTYTFAASCGLSAEAICHPGLAIARGGIPGGANRLRFVDEGLPEGAAAQCSAQ